MRKGLIRTRYAGALWLVLLYTKEVIKNKKKKEKTAFFRALNEYSGMHTGLVHTATEKAMERYLKTIGAELFDRGKLCIDHRNNEYIVNTKTFLPFILFFETTFSFSFPNWGYTKLFFVYLKRNLIDHGHSEHYVLIENEFFSIPLLKEEFRNKLFCTL